MDAVGSPAGSGDRPASLFVVGHNRSSGVRRYQPLVVLTLAVAAGVVCDRYGPRTFLASGIEASGEWSCFVLAWSSCACCLALWLVAWSRHLDRTAAWILLVAAAFAGSTWHELNWFLFDRSEIGRYAHDEPEPVCMDAIARESPERVTAPTATPLRTIPVSERSRLTIEVIGVRDAADWKPASGTCQLSVEGHLLGVHEGDHLRIFGKFARVAPPLNPGEFDFAANARADGRLVRVRSSLPECVTKIEAGSNWSLTHLIDVLRQRAKQRVRTLVGPNHAGLAAAILLGAREGLPQEEMESYLVTGTIHVLVVSGMNVAILATGLLALMRLGWVSRRMGLSLIIFVIVAYTLLAELQPPVVRAAVLGVLMCIAAWSGRQAASFNSLFAAGLVVLVMNPNDLFRVGPQLSFLAVGILIWIGSLTRFPREEEPDRLEQMLAAVRPWYRKASSGGAMWLGWLLATSLIIWLLSLPLVLNRFHVAAPISILISPAIWLFVFGAMWSGFVMLVAGWMFPPIAALSASVFNLSLSGLDFVVHWAESIPRGHVWLAGPAWWWVAVFYICLVLLMIGASRVVAPRWQVAGLAVWIIVGLVPPLARGWTRDGLDCTAVAVGHGECVVIEAPTGETLLYDAGGIGAPEFSTQTISSFLWARGVNRIDGIVLSHADTDHYNAVPGLLERFRVGAVYVSPVMFETTRLGDDRGPAFLKAAIENARVPIREIWSGNVLHVGSAVTVQVFHPPQRGVVGTDNANSVTVGVEYAGRRILLPGDLEPPGLNDVMAEEPYDCDVLLAPHHGSRRSDPPGFAAWSKPEWVVLSGGGGELPAPVIRTYEQAGARVFVTDEVGAVQFHISADSLLTASTWRGGNQLSALDSKHP